MVLLHLQIELRPRNRWLYHYDVDICRIQLNIWSTAKRLDGYWIYVHLLWRVFWCFGKRHQ